MVRGRRGKKPDRHPGEESPCTGLRGLIRPCRTCPGKEQPADKKTGKAAAFPVRPEREVRGPALKGVAGGLKGLVRQFGLLLEQLPDAPVRDAVPAGQKAHLGIAGGTGGGMAAEGAEQLPLAHLTGETGAAGDIQTGTAVSSQQAAQDGLGQQGAQQVPFRREAAGDAQGQAAAVFQKPVQGGIIFQNLAQQAYAFGQKGQQAVPVHGGGGSGGVPGKRGRTSATGPHGGPPGPGGCGGAGDVPPTVVPCRPPLARP